MLKKLRLNLQLFAEGGDGGSSAGEGVEGAGTVSGEEIPSSVPERARKRYQEALAKHGQSRQAVKTQEPDVSQTTTDKVTTKMSYADLIKSDEYKDEHKAYMDKTLADRLKRYKDIEETNGQMRGLLETVAQKYGVDASAETFLSDLSSKIDADDSYYEKYAIEHDMSPQDARRLVSLQRQIESIEKREADQQKQVQMQKHLQTLQSNAEKTKQRFPDFNLEKEMQDERFRRLCAVNNGDTTAAYMACHWQEVMQTQAQSMATQIQQQTAQAVAANRARPVESGISSTASSVATPPDFSKMTLEEIRQYANEQRRKQRGR